jgi:hypothetical protein
MPVRASPDAMAYAGTYTVEGFKVVSMDIA